MFTGEQIKKKRKSLGLSAEQLADILGVKKDNIYKWEKGTKPNNAEDYLKVENWLNGKMENIPREIGNESKKVFISHDSTNPETDLMRAVLSLTKSNEALVSQHSEILQANKAIAETNRILAEKVATENAPAENPIAFDSILSGLRELIVDLGLGKRWSSRDEGAAIFRSKVFGGPPSKTGDGTRKSSGKDGK